MRLTTKLVLFLFATLFLPISVLSATVSGSTVYDGNSTYAFLQGGQVCFTSGSSTCFPVSMGAFSGSVSPATYTFTVVTSTSAVILTIPNLVISSSGWNFDTWQAPSTSPPVPVFSGMGRPYSLCQPGALYTILNPLQVSGNSIQTTYICGDDSQNRQWYAAPSNPSADLTRSAQRKSIFSNLPTCQAPGTSYSPGSDTCIANGGSGIVLPSPQLSMFYQPNSGTAAAAVGDPSITTDGAGNLHAGSLAVSTALSAGSVNLTPNAASATYFGGGNDLAQAINAAAAASTNGRVDATGFANGSYTITHTIAIPLGAVVQLGPNVSIVCNMTGAPCVTLGGDAGGGSSLISTGRNNNRAAIIEGSLFNGTPSNSVIGSSQLTISSWSITGSVLTVTTTGYLGGNLPGGLVGQNVTLWGLTEKFLNGMQGNVTGVSTTSFTMAINASHTGSATESGLVEETPFPLVSAASGAGTQQSFAVNNIMIQGLPSNTNPVGPCLDVQGVFIPTIFNEVGTYNCNGGAVRIHPGTSQKIATDIVFINLQANDGGLVDHPGCIVSIDALDQSSVGAGVGNISFFAGAIQYPQRTPMLCINGNGLNASRSIGFYGKWDWELGNPAGGVRAGAYFPDVNPIQITDVADVTIDSLGFVGVMASVAGAPTAVVELSASNLTPGNKSLTDLTLRHIQWPNAANGWAANPIGVLDNVSGVNPTSFAYSCCWNQINEYAPNYNGTRITDSFALNPLPTDVAPAIKGAFDYNSTLNRVNYNDGAVFQSIANLNDLSPYMLPGSDLLAGSGLFSTNVAGVATGWSIGSSCSGIITCTPSISTTSPPSGSGSNNIQVINVTASTSNGGSQIQFAQSVNIVAGQVYDWSVWLKQDVGLGAKYAFAITDGAEAIFYCGSQIGIALIPTAWTQKTLSCTATTTVTGAILRIITIPGAATTGSVYINNPVVIQAAGFGTSGSPVCTLGGGTGGAGTCTAAQIVAAIGATPVGVATTANAVMGITAAQIVTNTGCGGSQSHCLALAGQQTPQSGTAAYLTFTNGTYTLPTNTLNANGCVHVSFAAHHSTIGASPDVLARILVGASALPVDTGSAAGEVTQEIYYCNTGSTSAGNQTLLRTVTASSTGSNTVAGFAVVSIASTSTITFSAQFNTAATEQEQLDSFRVELIQ